jgi:inositol transport system ATP-binding protein
MLETILQIKHLSKSFLGVKALENVQLSLNKGEVLALMGENGAGKSTLMKILVGLLQPDSGTIHFNGTEIKPKQGRQALVSGISMIHQEILMIPELTIAQNIFLGREKEIAASKWGWLNESKLHEKAQELLDKLGLDIPVTWPMKRLSVAQMQMIEIAKAISNDAKIIIMDEPTSAISDKEVRILFHIIKELKSKGVSIIYISHKMEEIFEIADTITVLRDGHYIATKPVAELDMHGLIALMVGREIDQLYPVAEKELGDKILSVENLAQKGKFSGVNLDIHAGEVIGIAGLMGAGRTEFIRTLCGMEKADTGTLSLRGKIVQISTPREAIRLGIGHVSEDRKGLGFIPKLSVLKNLTLSSLQHHQKGLLMDQKSEAEVGQTMIDDLQIKCSSPQQPVGLLSGGNQQKVVIGRVLLTNPDLIILDEPTRGVDVGAKFEIYRLINELARQGKAVLMISSELPEILGMSDRIMVMSKGKQTALLSRKEASQELIMKYAVQ